MQRTQVVADLSRSNDTLRCNPNRALFLWCIDDSPKIDDSCNHENADSLHRRRGLGPEKLKNSFPHHAIIGAGTYAAGMGKSGHTAEDVGAADDADQTSVVDDWDVRDTVGFQYVRNLGEGRIFGNRNDVACHNILCPRSARPVARRRRGRRSVRAEDAYRGRAASRPSTAVPAGKKREPHNSSNHATGYRARVSPHERAAHRPARPITETFGPVPR